MPLDDRHYLARLGAAVAYRKQGLYSEALDIALDIAQERPEESSVRHTLAQLYTDLGQFDLALSSSEAAQRLAERNGVENLYQRQNIALGLAAALMRFGQFERAWPLWELGRLGASWQTWPASTYWTGETGADSLLVLTEGGYGDIFMFMRWLPCLKLRKNVRRVGLMVWKALETFCGWYALGVDHVYVIDRDIVPFDWQYSISIMSLPAAVEMKAWPDIPKCNQFEGGPGIESPDGVYLVGTDLRKPLNGRPLRLGFCWRAEENTSPVRTKSLPVAMASQIVDALVNQPDRAIDVFSLSPEKSDLYNDSRFGQPEGVEYEPGRMTNWRATAEYLCSMDFVLTVDTAVAHLCGLLGVPALVLLPCSSCWRWGVQTSRTHWYGPQMTLYRQPEPLVWQVKDIMTRIMERISAL